MSKSILVPFDGSSLSRHTLLAAARLARRSAANIRLLSLRTDADSRSRDDGESDATHTVNALVERLRRQGVSVSIEAHGGPPCDAILKAAHAPDVSLIVMATPVPGSLEQLLFGCLTDDVVRESPVPLLLVTDRADAAASRRFDRILVPLDGSPDAERALPAATMLAEDTGASLILLHAVEPAPLRARGHAPAAAHVQECQGRAEGRAYLEETAARLRRAVPRVDVRVVSGEPARAIAEVADRELAAVAMATNGRGALARLLLGSVEWGVLRRAHVPVLVLGPTAEVRADGAAAGIGDPSSLYAAPEPAAAPRGAATPDGDVAAGVGAGRRA